MTSLFRKQFFLFTGTLVLTYTIMGIGLIQAFNGFFLDQKRELLIDQCEKISVAFESSYVMGNQQSQENLKREMGVLSGYLNSDFFIVDKSFRLILNTDDQVVWDFNEKNITYEDLLPVMDGQVVDIRGNLGGIYPNPVFTLAYPVRVNGEVFGAILMNVPVTEITETTNEAYQIIAVFILIAILFGFVLVYLLSKKISTPLVEINEAARVIANGDFEKRIHIDSDDEIGELADSFNEMANSLFLQEKRRREFISNISHDLRSPLTSMRGFLQAIIDGTIPYEKQEHYLNIVLEESERLATMANNILEINKLEEPESKLNISKFDVNSLVKKTAYSFEERVNQKDIKMLLTFDRDNVFVDADYDKILRVIYNLVDNAVKFTHRYGNINISTAVEEDKVFVKIRDNGKGISEEQQKRVFERLYKADPSRGRDKKGSGLGLSIVKEFIKAHGENITLKSELNKGTEFTFSLKLSEIQDVNENKAGEAKAEQAASEQADSEKTTENA